MKRINSIIIFLGCIFILVNLYAAVPHIIEYTGRLTNKDGNSMEGTYTIEFRIYDTKITGTGSILWQETYSNLVIEKGMVKVLLGEVNSLTLAFDKQYFLEIVVNGEVLSPRQIIAGAGYVIRAETAETVDSVSYADKAAIADSLGEGNGCVPKGAIIICRTGCPAGYKRVSELDGKFLVSGSSYNPSAGRSNQKTLTVDNLPPHAHDVSHSHDVIARDKTSASPQRDNAVSYNSAIFSNEVSNFITGMSGDTGLAGSEHPFDTRPEFATVIFCEKE